jgi:phosphate transport system permease protein
LASLLASHFPEAGQIEIEALMYAALALLAITLVVNMLGTAILTVAQRRISGRS